MELPRRKRWIVFTLFLSLIFIMNMDQGIISGTTTELKRDLLLTEAQLGMLGSILFIGSTLGCVLSFTFINKFDRRKMLLISIALNAIALFSFTLTKNYCFMLFCRVISGLILSFIGIYTGVWCDQFGIWNRRALMLALSHVTSPFGYIAGYVLGICFNWRITFYIQSIILIVHFPVLLWLIDPIYFSITLRAKKLIDSTQAKASIQTDDEDDEADSLFEDIPISSLAQKDSSNSVSTWTELKVCLKSFVFNMSTLALSFIFLIISGIQFWSNDYMETILNISNDYTRLMIFGSISLTAPTIGILLSGVITTKIGGYEARHAILIPLIGALMVSLIANLVVITNSVTVFSVAFWLYLFFGSFCLPPLTGIIMTSVPALYSGNANSLSTLIYNVAGKFPAPYLYGMLKKYNHILGVKFPMVCLLNSALFGVVFLAFASSYRYRLFSKDKTSINGGQCQGNSSPQRRSPTDHKQRLFSSSDISSFTPEHLREETHCYGDICPTPEN